MRKLIVIIFIMLCCCFLLSACFLWTEQPTVTKEYIDKIAELVPSEESSDPSVQKDAKNQEDLAIEQNSSDQVLQAIVEQMKQLENPVQFSIKGTYPEEIDTIMTRAAFLLDMPGIGFTSRCWQESQALTVSLIPEYTDGFAARMYSQNPELKGKLGAATIKLYEKTVSIIDELDLNTATDVEKALQIRNYLIDHVSYASNESEEQDHHEIHEAKGALLDRIAVCDGYSDAYQLLLAIAGIRSIPVTGKADGGPHAWNLVQLQGEWFHVDVTWDDPVREGTEKKQDKEQTSYNYGYFLINDDWIKKDHKWDTGLYPKATSLRLNPYFISGRVAGSYEEFKHLVMESILKGEKEIELYILSYHKSEYLLDFLDMIPRSFSYEVPNEGKNGVFRLTFD